MPRSMWDLPGTHAKSLQSCPTLCDHMDCSPLGSSVHGILQARIQEWVAISFSGDLPRPGIKLVSPALAGRFLMTGPPGRSCMIYFEVKHLRKENEEWVKDPGA